MVRPVFQRSRWKGDKVVDSQLLTGRCLSYFITHSTGRSEREGDGKATWAPLYICGQTLESFLSRKAGLADDIVGLATLSHRIPRPQGKCRYRLKLGLLVLGFPQTACSMISNRPAALGRPQKLDWMIRLLVCSLPLIPWYRKIDRHQAHPTGFVRGHSTNVPADSFIKDCRSANESVASAILPLRSGAGAPYQNPGTLRIKPNNC